MINISRRFCNFFDCVGVDENAENSAASSTNDVQQSQAVFPTAISSTVLCLVDLLFDHELNINNQSSKFFFSIKCKPYN